MRTLFLEIVLFSYFGPSGGDEECRESPNRTLWVVALVSHLLYTNSSVLVRFAVFYLQRMIGEMCVLSDEVNFAVWLQPKLVLS